LCDEQTGWETVPDGALVEVTPQGCHITVTDVTAAAAVAELN
jgi:hypothetical protein